VDGFLLDLLEDRVFTARDFGELPNGICRIAAPLTHQLALMRIRLHAPQAYRSRPARTGRNRELRPHAERPQPPMRLASGEPENEDIGA
jgi:hypothetical protein